MAYSPAYDRGFKDGKTMGKAEADAAWEAIPLKSVKDLTDELASANDMLDANRKEVSRLNKVVANMADERDGLLKRIAALTLEAEALRASLAKRPMPTTVNNDDFKRRFLKGQEETNALLTTIAARI